MCFLKSYKSSKEMQLTMRWEGGRMLREEVEVDLDLEKGRVEGERKKRCHYRKMELCEYL